MKMACKVYNLSKKEMKSFLFVEAFLKALRKLPTIICIILTITMTQMELFLI